MVGNWKLASQLESGEGGRKLNSEEKEMGEATKAKEERPIM